MDEILSAALKNFGQDPDTCRLRSVGTGHIHQTYKVEKTIPGQPPLLLQRINHHVFRDVELLMRNLERVTAHIAEKNRQAGKDPAKNGVFFLRAEGGKNWTGDESAGYWRLCRYIEDHVYHENAGTPELALAGGSAVAHFQSMLADLDPGAIGDSIPGFHDLELRIGQFEHSLDEAPTGRLKKAANLIQKAREHRPAMTAIQSLSRKKRLPVRITHNDTKFNNILFDRQGKAVCMIDLDTVMPGYSWFDFADSLRTCANTAAEDEVNPEAIHFRLDIYEAFTRGFLAEGSSYLTKEEISLLPRAPAVFAYMQGLRFLTDFLGGDQYYKTEYPEHNFVRTNAQFTLMDRIVEKEEQLAVITRQVEDHVRENRS